jgi:hypothetical protein
VYHNQSHARAELLLSEGYTVRFETGEIIDPAGQVVPLVSHKNRPRIQVTIRCYTFNVFVHKLVAYAAYGADAFKPGYSIHHQDGNRHNNTARNLRVMHIEAHAALHGCNPKAASV